MPSAPPLVSIGFPVRNGGAATEFALASLVNQTYRNIEIIISDNGSSDRTGEMCRALAAKDPRVRYFVQDPALTVWENFRFVFEKSAGKYFMWAAHDDWRTPNYIDVLLAGFRRVPNASLVFSDLVLYDRIDSEQALAQLPSEKHEFQTDGLDFPGLLRRLTSINQSHIYGLLAADYLRGYAFHLSDLAPDLPLLFNLATRGPFVYEPGARFYRWNAFVRKTVEERAMANEYRPMAPFANLRLARLCKKALDDTYRELGRSAPHAMSFRFYYHICQGFKGMVYQWSPLALRRAWHTMKRSIKQAQQEASR